MNENHTVMTVMTHYTIWDVAPFEKAAPVNLQRSSDPRDHPPQEAISSHRPPQDT